MVNVYLDKVFREYQYIGRVNINYEHARFCSWCGWGVDFFHMQTKTNKFLAFNTPGTRVGPGDINII